MARESREIVNLTLELTGFNNFKACRFGYQLEELRDELQSMANAKKYGRIKILKADKLLIMLIKDLKLIPVDCQFSLEEWGKKAISILSSFRLAKKKRWNMIRKYQLRP